jgi:hypothetical protein
MILTGKTRRTQRKTCRSAILSTTNPTWTDLGANPGLRGDRPATNRLNAMERPDVGLKPTTIPSFKNHSQFVILILIAMDTVHSPCGWQTVIKLRKKLEILVTPLILSECWYVVLTGRFEVHLSPHFAPAADRGDWHFPDVRTTSSTAFDIQGLATLVLLQTQWCQYGTLHILRR